MTPSSSPSATISTFAVGAAVFDRVAQQVPDDLADVAVVAAHGRQARRDDGRDVRPEPDRPLALDDRRQDPLEEDRLAADQLLAALDAGKDQQVLDQAVESLGLGRDVGDELARDRRIELLAAPEQDLAAAVDRGDRRPQLVRQDADEGVAQVVVLEPVGDVGQDGDRRLLALRLEGADREVDRERRPILAQRVASSRRRSAGRSAAVRAGRRATVRGSRPRSSRGCEAPARWRIRRGRRAR